MVESSNTDVSSVILHLETLTNKYDQLLLKYKRAQAEYILFLKESPSKGQNTDPARKFIRKNAHNYKTATLLTNNRVDNIDKCEAVCAANPLCTGATYSNKGSTCFTMAVQKPRTKRKTNLLVKEQGRGKLQLYPHLRKKTCLKI